MFLFLLGGFKEDRGDLLVALFLGNRGEVGVLIARLGFAGKGGLEVFLGGGAFQFFHVSCSLC